METRHRNVVAFRGLIMKELLNELTSLLSIRSVYDASTISAQNPYGKGVGQALDFMRQLVLNDGFDVSEYEGHAIAIHYGTQAERIDIVSHLDVVEAGEGWDSDPFTPIIKNGRLIARGSQDMKSAAILTYFALHEIKARNLPLKRQLRLVYGTDEERTMKDIETYIEMAGQPEFALTPDGFFPLSIGEKGALMWVVEGELDLKDFGLTGGIQCNVVAPSCTFTIPNQLIPKVIDVNRHLDFEIQINQAYDKGEVSVKGIASHASAPDQGHNAIVDALILLAEVITHPTLKMLAKAFKSPYGEGCEIAFEKEPMGKLTLNLGTLKIHDGKLLAQVDCRYPFGIDSTELTRKLRNALPGLDVSLPYDAKPILNDIDSPFIQTVLKQYREWSHDTSEPVISGGVSYCKVIDHCIAFGPLSKDMEIMAHQKNESIEIDYLERLYPLYRDTMIALANLEETDD